MIQNLLLDGKRLHNCSEAFLFLLTIDNVNVKVIHQAERSGEVDT